MKIIWNKDLTPISLIRELNKTNGWKVITKKQFEYLTANFAHKNMNSFNRDINMKSSQIKFHIQTHDNERLVLLSNMGHLIEFTDNLKKASELPECLT